MMMRLLRMTRCDTEAVDTLVTLSLTEFDSTALDLNITISYLIRRCRCWRHKTETGTPKGCEKGIIYLVNVCNCQGQIF